MSLSRKQLALVHIAKQQLGLSEEGYRAILRHMGDAESSKYLDQTGFELAMQYMVALGFRSEFTERFYGHRRGIATPAQVSLIRALWDEYTDGESTELALGEWLGRTFNVSALRFVTRAQARKASAALKAMKARKFENEPLHATAKDAAARTGEGTECL